MKKFLIYSMLFSFVAASIPLSLYANEIKPTHNPNSFERVSNGVRAVCEWTLVKTENLPGPIKKLGKAAGWLIPVIPMSKALSHPNKVQIAWEMMRSGISIQAIAYVLSRLPRIVVDQDLSSLTEIASLNGFWKHYLSQYLSYHTVNTARNGTALDQSLTIQKRVQINWLLSVWIYFAMELGPKFSKVSGDEAVSLFAFQMIWATVSEVIRQTYTTPLFYHKYPKGTFIEEVRRSMSVDEISKKLNKSLEEMNIEFKSLKEKSTLTPEEKIRKQTLVDEMISARENLVWVKFLLTGIDEASTGSSSQSYRDKSKHEKTSEEMNKIFNENVKKLNSKKDWKQMKVGTALLAIYLFVKHLLNGDKNEPGLLLKLTRYIHGNIDDLLSEFSDPNNPLIDRLTSDLVKIMHADGVPNSGYLDGYKN